MRFADPESRGTGDTCVRN